MISQNLEINVLTATTEQGGGGGRNVKNQTIDG
jgi:hypothetical protein